MAHLEQRLATGGVFLVAFCLFACDLIVPVYRQYQYSASYSPSFIAASRRSFLTVKEPLTD